MKGGKDLMANDGRALKERLFLDKNNGWKNLSDEELKNMYQETWQTGDLRRRYEICKR